MLCLYSSARRVTIVLLANTMAVFLNSQTEAFNIGTQDVRVFSGTDGTHFGYTMSFDTKTSSEGHMNLLIGAPKMKRTINQEKRQETGGLITCYDILDDIKTCTEEPNDNKFPVSIYDVTDVFLDVKSHIGGGYAHSLTVSDDGSRFICAPFWKDLKWTAAYGMTFMPGRCVAYLQSQGKTVFKHVMTYFRRWPYVKDKNYFTGMAGFGVASDVYENLVFAVGVPGLTISEGGVTIIDYRDVDKEKVFTTTKQYRDTIGTTAYGYLGYQVKFGKFCNDPSVCLVAGAPNVDTVGVVRLYNWVNEELLVNFQTLQGEEPWAYFGSVLCAVDTDGDDNDELLVGAPYYSGTYSGFDTGKVYLYKRKPISKFFYLLQGIIGPETPWSRFGAAIQVIGDINLDTFSDVAIGAPGEDDGTGCVYIYFGYVGGGIVLNQKLCAKKISALKPPIRGFGSTFSGASYSEKSPYPVFAVGAFPSDKVLLFQSKPILDVTATLYANPNPIDIEETCNLFTSEGPCPIVTLCMRHNVRKSKLSNELQKEQKFRIDLKFDDKSKTKGLNRAAFVTDDGQLVDTLQLSKQVKAKEQCFDFKSVIRKKDLERDRFTPIQIECTYDLEIDPQSRDSSLPVMDPTADNKMYHMITFANDCGSDNICFVNLKAGQRLLYPTNENGDDAIITFGHTQEITVLVTVSNSQESCYWTQIVVKLDQPLVLNRYNSDTIRECKYLTTAHVSRDAIILCNYYPPLETGDVIGVTLTFESENLADDRDSLTISTEVKPKDKVYNPEKQPIDNKVERTTNIRIVADVSILGNAVPLELKIDKRKKIPPSINNAIQEVMTVKQDVVNKITLNHKVLVKNKGPSFLPKTNLTLNVPVYIPDGTLLVIETSVKLIAGDKVIDCSKQMQIPGHMTYITSAPSTPAGGSGVTTEGNDNAFVPPVVRVKRSITDNSTDEDLAQASTYTMSCHKTPEYCKTYTCSLPNVIPQGGHAELNVTLTLDRDNIPIPETFTSFKLELTTVLEEPDHKLFKPWTTTNTKQVVAITHTTFHLYESGGTINPWIIAGSVGFGILLIVIIVLVCWKLGFFKRKTHYQVEKWKRESFKSKRESQKSRRESHHNNDE